MDFVKTVFASVVAVILISVVAIPIFTSISEHVASVEENTDELFLTMNGSDTLTFSSDADGFTINGERHAWPTSSTGATPDRYSTPMIFGSDFMVTPPVSLGNNTWSESHVITADATMLTSSLTISGGTMTYVADGTEATVQVHGPVYYVSDEGTYGMFKNTAHIDNSATAYVVLYDWNSTAGTRAVGIWSMKDTEKSEVFAPVGWTSADTTHTPRTVVFTDSAEREEVSYTYTLTGYTVDETARGPGHVTIVCPVEYHVVTDADQTTLTVMMLVPVILAIGLVIAIVNGMTRGIKD